MQIPCCRFDDTFVFGCQYILRVLCSLCFVFFCLDEERWLVEECLHRAIKQTPAEAPTRMRLARRLTVKILRLVSSVSVSFYYTGRLEPHCPPIGSHFQETRLWKWEGRVEIWELDLALFNLIFYVYGSKIEWLPIVNSRTTKTKWMVTCVQFFWGAAEVQLPPPHNFFHPTLGVGR